jgi:hypothetical protein
MYVCRFRKKILLSADVFFVFCGHGQQSEKEEGLKTLQRYTTTTRRHV